MLTFFLGGAEGVPSAFLFLAPFVAVVVAGVVAGVVAAGVLDLLAGFSSIVRPASSSSSSALSKTEKLGFQLLAH